MAHRGIPKCDKHSTTCNEGDKRAKGTPVRRYNRLAEQHLGIRHTQIDRPAKTTLQGTTRRRSFGVYPPQMHRAGMAELADAADLKSAGRKVLRVRTPLPVPTS